jgi:hypothetical protein
MSYLTMAVPPFETTDGTALANSTTLTDISTAPQKFIPAGQLEAGYEIELRAQLELSTTGTPTLLVGFYLGGVAGVALAASTAVTQGTATAWPLEMYWRGVVRSIGPTGTIYGQGHIHVPSSTVGAQWGAASASNTITCKDLSVLILNAR